MKKSSSAAMEEGFQTEEIEQHPSSSSAASSSTSKHRPNRLFWIVGIVAVCAVGLGVGLGVGLRKNSSISGGGGGGGGQVNDQDGEDEDSETESNIGGSGTFGGDNTAENNVNEALLSSPTFFSSTSDSNVEWTLQSFSRSIVDGYGDCAHLRGNLTQVSYYLADLIIESNKDYEPNVFFSPEMADSTETAEMDNSQEEAPNNNKQTTSDQSNTEDTTREDSFGTNNQEQNVQEADIVKSDGTFVYAAYGDVLAVWDAHTGQKLSWTIMPPFQQQTPPEQQPQILPSLQSSIVHKPQEIKPQISALILDTDHHRLLAIVSGYTYWTYWMYSSSDDQYPALSDYGTLRAMVYDIHPDLIPIDGNGPLTLLKAHDLQGSYRAARSIGSSVQIVTMSNVNSYSWTSKLERWRDEFQTLSTQDYVQRARELVPALVEQFVDKLMMELGLNHSASTCDHIVGLSSFQTGQNFTIFASPWGDGVANGYAQVTTLDLSADQTTLDLSSPDSFTGVFVPNAWSSHVYASEDFLVLANQGYAEDPDATSFTAFDDLWAKWTEATMFVNFELQADGSAAKPHSVGQATGWLLNQFSMDEHNGYLRVATTNQNRWGCVSVQIQTHKDGTSFETCDNWDVIRNATNQITVLEYPQSIATPAETSPAMKIVGFLGKLGKPRETIFACRFMGDRAFVVTFRRIDPFYAIDMSDPTKPFVAGELEIPGFSNYLHPFDGDDSDLIVAVGQDADANGRPLGLQVALYDVSDMSMPEQVDVHIIENSEDQWSSSEVQWEHKSFRLLSKMKKILLPVSHRCPTHWAEPNDEEEIVVSNEEEGESSSSSSGGSNGDGDDEDECVDFDGFQIFGFNETNIWYEFSVSHADSSYFSLGWCWYDAYLPSRSLVFQGKMTSIKGHTVISTDLITREELWVLNLDENLDEDDCSTDYWPA